MKLITISRKASGRLYNAVKNEDGKGFTNPLVEFEGVDVKNLPSVKELLDLCGDQSARYLADGFNNAAFDAARDPFDPLIPSDFDDEKYKWARTSLISMVKLTGKTPEEVAKILGW